MKTVKIKTFHHGWREVREDRARAWAMSFWEGDRQMDDQTRYDFLSERLQGTTLYELTGIERPA